MSDMVNHASQIKAIETRYKGYRFRSRLEARWAVFFDALNIPYEYEKQGYDLGQDGPYLPDFWLPGHKLWMEVKGEEPTEDEHAKSAALARMTEWPVVIVSGQIGGQFCEVANCWLASYQAHVHYGSPGLYARHNLPRVYREDVESSSLVIGGDWSNSWQLFDFVLSEGFSFTAIRSTESVLEEIVKADLAYFLSKYGKDHPTWKHGWRVQTGWIANITAGEWTSFQVRMDFPGTPSDRVMDAFVAARSARFEHGENGNSRAARKT